MKKRESTSLFYQLKSATQAYHDEVERVAYAQEIKQKELQLPQYEQLITKNWRIYYHLEKELDKAINKLPADHWASAFFKKRTPILSQDLEVLGLLTPEPLNAYVPTIQTIPQIIGTMYVMEGSMLGGQMIGKMLAKNSHLEVVTAFYFFGANGGDTRQRWLELMKMGESFSFSTIQQKQVIDSAIATFQFYTIIFSATDSLVRR